jgi:DNA helicase-2/ATP-dependent DNA helicase PcrA
MSQDPFSMDNYTPPSEASKPKATVVGADRGVDLGTDRPYMAGLNDEQKQAVESLDGPLLVLAGAGTGKTRVLTTRLTHLFATGKATPGEVLALTFTNKAAQEMSERVSRMIGRPTGHMAIGTFHSIAARLLRPHASLLGLQSNFTILDADDQIRLLKHILKEQNIDNKEWPAKNIAGLIDHWKNKALTPDKISPDQAFHFAEGKGKIIYDIYQQRLKILNACDFGDLLLHMYRLLQENPAILKQYQERFRYILVDEYQDTNSVQYLWLRLLAQKNKNICCVGDDDQSIYGWRGAEVGNILKFEQDFPGAKVIRLEQNYRSTTHILGAASGLINANKGRLGKTLWTNIDGGDKVSVMGVWDGREEAKTIGDEIEAQQQKGTPLSEMAVLVRAGSQMRLFEEQFLRLGLPYRVVGGPRFYERQEIRDALAYLKIINQPSFDLAFERIINVPKRALGLTSVQKLHILARENQTSLYAAAEDTIKHGLMPAKACGSLSGLLAMFEKWREQATSLKLDQLMDEVLDSSGLIEMWKADKDIKAEGRIENLQELVRAMADYDDLEEFLEHVSLVMENSKDAGKKSISIMTLHGSKGLEFDLVFLPGWEETIFPSQRSVDEKGINGLEEERRLAYVGLTRAKKKAHVYYAGSRQVFGSWLTLLPSRFIDELPDEHCEKTSALTSEVYDQQGITDTGYSGYSGYSEKTHLKPWDSSYNSSWKKSKSQSSSQTREERISKSKNRFAKKAKQKQVVTSDFAIGERVFHEKFGYGIVEDVEGDILEIKFDNSDTKKLIDDYVKKS